MADKQAVVVVHGMGEQTPMATLRSFVKAVWVKNPNMHMADEDPNGEAEIWIKPDATAGLQELRRITTREIKDKNGKVTVRRTDFFEFYWADLMQGTTWQHFLSWTQGLLFRAPSAVPVDVFIVWATLWLIAIALAIAATVSILNIVDIRSMICSDPGLLRDICALWPENVTKTVSLNQALTGGALAIVGGLAYLLSQTSLAKIAQEFRYKRAWASIPLFIILMIAIFFIGFLIAKSSALLAAISLAFGMVIHSFLVPYFGDVARYVTASPENVAKRKMVRDRGLKLLKELHESGDYDRIILVSHSLGTIVAYDILNLLWAEIGPTKSERLTVSATKKLDALDKWLTAHRGKSFPSLSEFREKQREISRELTKESMKSKKSSAKDRTPPWLISDFITMGSPLTHAEFLIADNERSLGHMFAERTLSSCPPVLETGSRQDGSPSFLFSKDGWKTSQPHHAAVFSAVRWTNIHDPHGWWAFLRGDVISGPVSANFGRGIVTEHELAMEDKKPKASEPRFSGIKEIAVPGMQRSSWLAFKRTFTHTLYWDWQNKFDPESPPYHITVLRNALNLRDSEES